MKNYFFVFVLLLVFLPSVSAQDDYEEWVKEQQRLIDEGYGTIFDTYAYQNGDYYILDDGRIALGNDPMSNETRSTTEEERREIEEEWYKSDRQESYVSERIQPTSEIGLFIDNTLFYEYLFRSRMGSLITDMKYETDSDAGTVIRWLLPGSSMISCYMNRFGKIDNIVIKLSGDFSKSQEILDYDDVIYLVLQATGLPYSIADVYSAVTSVNENNYWNGWLFGITVYLDPYSVSAMYNIMSSYDFNDDDPYSVMSLFDTACDTNYVGACVPIVNYDLNCEDIGVRNFFVIGNDVHRFDGDGNGVCCEPYPIQ